MTHRQQVRRQRSSRVSEQDERAARMPIPGDAGEGVRVLHVVIPGHDAGPLAVAATVADAVHGMDGVTARGEAPSQRVVQTEMLGVAVQQHDHRANLAVGQPGVVVDAPDAAVEEGHDQSFRGKKYDERSISPEPVSALSWR